MPVHSWSISAKRCITGAKLRKIPGTPCSKCYAHRGHSVFKRTEEANERRLRAFHNLIDWSQKMAQTINLTTRIGNPYFRWFSSGDLQSVDMLLKIMEVCRLTPLIYHWLPTQERGFVAEALALQPQPKNLVIRISAPKFNAKLSGTCNSVVRTGFTDEQWADLVQKNHHENYYCPASINETYQCGSCRACWDKRVKTIHYKKR
jgi:hypothetical protein